MLKLFTMAQIRLAIVKDRGATAAEYGLIIALVAAVIFGVVVLLGSEIAKLFDDTCDKIASKTSTSGDSCNAS
jgi:pilus assembly protein Flp/PilA